MRGAPALRPFALALCLAACSRTGSVEPSRAEPVQVEPLAAGSPSAAVAPAVSATPVGSGGFNVESAHYQLYAEAPEDQAVEMGRLLEAAHEAFGAWFHAAPPLAAGERLQVRYYADAVNWQAGLAADGIAAPTEAGGFYAPKTRTAYLFQQGNPYYSHVLLIHEATHQFHQLSRTRGQELPFWYAEGHAEYLSRHDWDGHTIRLGVTPMLSWEDIASRVATPVDVARLVSGSGPEDRAAAWALFRHLDQGARHDGFERFRGALDEDRADAARSFAALVGDPAAISGSLAGWLAGAEEPMKPIFTEWIHVGPGAVTASSRSCFSLAIVKDPVTHFEARWAAGAQLTGAVGVVVAYQDDKDYQAVVLSPDGALRTFTALAGTTQWSDAGTAPTTAGVGTIAADFRDGGAVTVTVNGASSTCSIGTLPASAGLAVSDTRVEFHGVAWR